MLKQNTKMKADKIYSFGTAPGLTCPQAGDCKKYCYGCKGNYIRFSNILNSLIKATELSLDDSFVAAMNKSIAKKRNITLVRISTEGDFYSQDYLDKWTAIAAANPNVRFYAYTKSLHLDFTGFLALGNTKIIQSFGGKLDDQIDMTKPHARIFQNLAELLAAGYTDCSESDLHAANPSTIKVGLIAH